MHTSRRSAPNASDDELSNKPKPFDDEDERNIIEQPCDKLHGIPPFSNRSVGSPFIKPNSNFHFKGDCQIIIAHSFYVCNPKNKGWFRASPFLYPKEVVL